MKKLIIILLIIGSTTQAQTTISFYGSTKLTTGAEILVPVGEADFYLGGGFSGAWDVEETVPGHINNYDKNQTVTNKNRESWCSLYATTSFGYLGKFLIKYRGGLAVYNDKVTFNSDYTKVDKVVYKPLLGVTAMYSITKDIGLEGSYDTFNKFAIGFTILF
jgi:hypothetical protein